jgi:transcriptional regulator with XRE-family HTH domain
MTGRDVKEFATLDRKRIDDEDLVAFWAEHIESITAELTRALALRFKEDGLTQEVIADRLGKDKSTISRIFGGQRNLTVKTLSQICYAMDCDLRVSAVPFEDLPTPNYVFVLPEESETESVDNFVFLRDGTENEVSSTAHRMFGRLTPLEKRRMPVFEDA